MYGLKPVPFKADSKRSNRRRLGHDLEGIPQGLKPDGFWVGFAARLKSCPFKTRAMLASQVQEPRNAPQILRLRLKMTKQLGFEAVVSAPNRKFR